MPNFNRQSLNKFQLGGIMNVLLILMLHLNSKNEIDKGIE